ncbi:MAG: outer membrane protein transport protein [Desulfobacula sp.]|jgi:long-subunit fatty acid transport protein|nr:outer membrane protein transport protein [Desulfobacula sp.]
MYLNQYAVSQLTVKRVFVFFICLISIGSVNLSIAQVREQIQILSSPNPVGSGARALGMGGAFIAIADDATAASWNPGGLIQLEKPEISFVTAYFDRSIDTTFIDIPEASGKHNVSETRLNYFSISYPFQSFNRNMTISLNYQNLYDFTNKWSFPPIHQSNDSMIVNTSIDAAQNGSLSALGLAYCIEVIQNLSFGITFNLWEDGLSHKNQWEQIRNWQTSGSVMGYQITGGAYQKDTYDFSGFNINLGLLWNISGKWTLGAVLKTPFTADLKHERYYYESLQYPQNSYADFEHEDFFSGDEKLKMPMSYGIGVAYRMSDSFTISADIYRTEWSDFIHEDASGNKTSPITGTPENQADIDATHQVRLGAEYLFIRPKYVIPLRSGIFYDPAPAKGSSDNYFGLSLGSGVAYGKYIFDIALQYRFGNEVGESISQSVNSMQDVQETTIYSSFIVHF